MYIKKHTQVAESYKKLVLGFVILAVVLVGIILYFSASKAVIKITPKVTAIQTDFVADVVTDGGAIEKALQGVLYEKEVEGGLEGDATGSKMLDGGTIGKVNLINKRPEPQTLVKTTRLLTADGILLRLSDKVVVPANGEIEVNVYADDPNAFKELAPTKFTIPGLWEGLQSSIYGESKSTIKSSGESVKVVKAVDIARTKDKLTEELYTKAIADFNAQLPGKNFTVVVVTKKVLEEKVSVEAEATADKFTVNLKMNVTLVGLNQEEIMKMAGDRLRSVVPANQELLNLNANNFSYIVQNFDETKKTVNVKVHVEGDSVIASNHEIFNKEKLSGLSPKGLELYLSNFDEIEKVEVELSPFWVKNIPKLQDHIIITIMSPAK
ncbi:MAG: hypothetical protein UT02_C0019G0007 [Parcubacteria group bacterium GW2011_GWC2_38_7]|nr:MAG: hypothetical protein UT02_C0019G0007 [Parcubacteria group bacterium GW2011_GWC2_38_7]